MDQDRLDQQQRKWSGLLKIVTGLATVAILGSCVAEIDSLGGGRDTNQKMAGIFFYHLILIVPCLFGLYAYLRIKLDDHFAKSKTRVGDKTNKT